MRLTQRDVPLVLGILRQCLWKIEAAQMKRGPHAIQTAPGSLLPGQALRVFWTAAS